MKKIIALLACLTMLLSMAACAGNEDKTNDTTTAAPTTEAPTTEATEDTTEATEDTTEATEDTTEATEDTTEATEDTTEATEDTTEAVSGALASYIQLSISEEDGTTVSLMAYDDEAGGVYVEYVGDVKKVGTVDASVLEGLTNVLSTSGFVAMNGAEEYGEGMAFASVYCAYDDESMLTANYGGVIPQEFRDAYAIVDEYFQELVKDLPEYVPAAVVTGDVNSDILDAMNTLLNESGAEPLDAFGITDVPMDEYFASAMGLSKADGITSGATCAPLMTSVAFSCNVVMVEDESNVASVVSDFAANVDWNRWICVTATNAVVATKGNMVLCLVGSDELYQQFATAVEGTGWTVVETLINQ